MTTKVTNQPATPKMIPQLTIRHNHGVVVLTNVELIPYAVGKEKVWYTARGTVKSGGITSRLFWATSTEWLPVGEVINWDIFGRHVQYDEAGNGDVSTESCG